MKKQNKLAELRATVMAMMSVERRLAFGWVMLRLLDLGHIADVSDPSSQGRYQITGFRSLDEVEHLLATIDNRVQRGLVELSVLQTLCFSPEEDNLRFYCMEKLIN